MIWWPVLAAAGAVALWPFAAEALRPRMTQTRREAAPGHFAQLSGGRTHYRWLGAGEGPVAVCVHGLTTPSFVWELLAARLGEMGWRVLVYDLYGRGYSDRPAGAQDSAFFLRQLEELLADQGVTGEIALLGYSMGGAIATAFAARHPGQIRHLALLAPAGLGHDLGPVERLATNHDWLGRWLMLAVFPRSLRRALAAERAVPGAMTTVIDRQIAETRMRGFAPAVLASLRGILDEDLGPAHRAVAGAGVPVTAVWGGSDDVIPLSRKDRLAAINPAARQCVIEGAGHALTYSHAGDVAEALRPGLGA